MPRCCKYSYIWECTRGSSTFDTMGSTEIERESVRLLLQPPALALGMGVILAAYHSTGICEVCRPRLNKSHRLLAMAGAERLRMLACMSLHVLMEELYELDDWLRHT